MSEICFRALLVMLNRTNVSAIGDTNDHRERLRTLVSSGQLGQLGHNLVKRGIDKSIELNLAHRAITPHRQADCGSHNSRLSQGGVDNAVRTKLHLQTLSHAKHPTQLRNVFTHQHYRRVLGHSGSKPLSYCLS